MSTQTNQSNQSFDNLVGRKFVDDSAQGSISNSIPDSSVIKKSDLPEGTRVLGPDTMATMDFRPDRLNIHIDDEQKVIKTTKG